MKVLIISANLLPVTPSGSAYIAGAAIKAGHQVEIFDCRFAERIIPELKRHIKIFNPDISAISIRNVTGDMVDQTSEFYTKYFDHRPFVRGIVNCLKKETTGKIIPGGPGFNYFATEWLKYLDLDYGLRGEGEFSFPKLLSKIEKGGDIYNIPGAVYKKNDHYIKNDRPLIKDYSDTGFPAYELFDQKKYDKQEIPYAIVTKRGCAFNCSFCPHSSLEGTRYRLKTPERVVDEMEYVLDKTGSRNFNFCDNAFNAPKKHAEAICHKILKRNLNINWSTGSFKPLGVTKEQCDLFKKSGCDSLFIAVETASEKMLKSMNRRYKVSDVENTLSVFSESDIEFGISILLGAPGETPDTIKETFDLIHHYPKINFVWVSIGLNLWTSHQKVIEIARKEGQLIDDKTLFSGSYYISPELPKDFMIGFIDSLKDKKNYAFQVNMPYKGYSKIFN